MTLRFFNTLGRDKQEFTPLQDTKVGIYSCGPTVYNYVHIGNLRAYIFVDLLKRYLRFKGYDVTHVMNITDVDDKTIRDSKAQNKTLKDFTEFYTTAFLDDIKALQIESPSIMPKATDYIDEMIDMIQTLLDEGKAYEKNGTVYFKIEASKDYGELACLCADSLKQNADGRLNNSDEYEKDDARDFALWKAYSEDDGDVFWEAPFGKGRPGWHIECSAMSTKHLGNRFDIHTGGVDLIFPHHTNEIAQSQACCGEKYVNYWLHNAHLIVNGQKMSKSLGNFYTLADLRDKGYDMRAVRYELLKTHYRVQLDFKEDELKQIPETLAKFDEVVNKLQSVKTGEDRGNASGIVSMYLEEFELAMDDDLNISGGLAAAFDFIKEINQELIKGIGPEDAVLLLEGLERIDSVLGIMKFEKDDIPEEIVALAEKRLIARQEKNWEESDSLRDEIKEKGYEVLDEKDGYRLKKI